MKTPNDPRQGRSARTRVKKRRVNPTVVLFYYSKRSYGITDGQSVIVMAPARRYRRSNRRRQRIERRILFTDEGVQIQNSSSTNQNLISDHTPSLLQQDYLQFFEDCIVDSFLPPFNTEELKFLDADLNIIDYDAQSLLLTN